MKSDKPRRGADGHYLLASVMADDSAQVLGQPLDVMRRQLEREQIAGCLNALGLPNSPANRERIRNAIGEPLRRFFDGAGGELMRQAMDKRVDATRTRNGKASDEDEKRAVASLFDRLYDHETRITPGRKPKVTVLYADVIAQHDPPRALTFIKGAVAAYSKRHRPRKKVNTGK
ncbi:hypothetical protein C7416_103590 [Cupriavidus phytorum]|uniref:Uncharacterized protein n=1 Tax=Cupriavidus phytorum TaxID=3024399 RepID=A0A2W7PEY6_9BURK|nr:hypothetical protein [Cupriavidus alkaliphilus]PZX30857.1 hypothetical protein C7416_103590 [Cupriavidus alkaliphilus]